MPLSVQQLASGAALGVRRGVGARAAAAPLEHAPEAAEKPPCAALAWNRLKRTLE